MSSLRLAGAVLLGTLSMPGFAADVIDGEELIDPTRPLVVERDEPEEGAVVDSLLDRFRAAVPTEFEVSFVRAGSVSPMAIVNDQRVTIGDVISGATVVAIDRNSVTMEVDGLQLEVSLFGNSVKSPVRQQ